MSDVLADLLRELGRLQAENRRLRVRVRDVRRSRDIWRARAEAKALLSKDDPRHGTANGYNNLGCRCRRCTAAHSRKWRERTHRNGTRQPRSDYLREILSRPLPDHGTETRYGRGCRCDECRRASREARARRRAHTSSP